MPQSLVARGLKASDWIGQVSPLLNGKGGGREETAQCSGSGCDKVKEAMDLARQFAATKLN